MSYYYPFGETVHPLVQQDRTPKKVFVLGVYASAVHARWKRGNKIICQALAVASEPRIFWDGNPEEAAEIIGRIHIPKELGILEPAGRLDLRLTGLQRRPIFYLSPLSFLSSFFLVFELSRITSDHRVVGDGLLKSCLMALAKTSAFPLPFF